jgi:hypothetical protein
LHTAWCYSKQFFASKQAIFWIAHQLASATASNFAKFLDLGAANFLQIFNFLQASKQFMQF